MSEDPKTLERLDPPTILLVALSPEVEAACITTTLDSGVRVLKVRHVAPALERMPVAMPKIVVAQSSLAEDDAYKLADRAVAIGADVLWVDPTVDLPAFCRRLATVVSGLMSG